MREDPTETTVSGPVILPEPEGLPVPKLWAEEPLQAIKPVIKPVIPEKYLDEKTIFHLNPSGRFVIGGHMVMLGLPEGRSSLTLMEAGELMEVVPSLARIPPRWIVAEPTLCGRRQRALWLRALPAAALFRYLMPSECRSHCPCLWTLMAPARSQTRRSWRLSRRISISGPA